MNDTNVVRIPVASQPVDCGDFDIRIDRNGTWHYQGSPIRRQELVHLFASLLTRRPDGSYWLVTPDEMGRIQVDDVPFLIVEMFRAGGDEDQIISFRTNVDEIVTMDADHPLRMVVVLDSDGPAPYVLLRPGIEARLTRAVFYELVECGQEKKAGEFDLFGVWSSGTFFPIGTPAQ